MKHIERTCSLLIVLTLILGLLSACSGSGEDKTAKSSEFGYTASFKSIDRSKLHSAGAELGTEMCFDGERVYFTVSENREIKSENKKEDGSSEETIEYVSVASVYSMLPDGSDIKKLEGYVPKTPEGMSEDMNMSTGIQKLAVDKNGSIFVVEQCFTTGRDFGALRKLSKDGTEIASISFKRLAELSGSDENYSIDSFVVTPEGKVVLIGGSVELKILVLSPELNIEQKVEHDEGVTLMESGLSRKGEVFVHTGDAEGRSRVERIDLGSLSLKPYNSAKDLQLFSIFADADSEYDLYSLRGSQTVCGVDLEKGTEQNLFNWVEFGMNSEPRAFTSLGGGKYLAIFRNKDASDANYDLVLVEKKPAREITPREKLTLACLYLDEEDAQAVAKFNKENPRALIEIKDYSAYNTDKDSNAGVTKLMTELTAGNIPDIIVGAKGVNLESLAKKGALLDLKPLLAKDKDLGSGGLFEPVQKLIEQDGKMFIAYSGFELQTVLTPEGSFPERGVSFEEAKAALGKLKPGATYFRSDFTAESYSENLLAACMENFVDFSKGESRFDSRDFIDVLKFLKELPKDADIDWDNIYNDQKDPRERLSSGEQLFTDIRIGCFLDDFRAFYKVMDGKLAYSGYPGIKSGAGSVSLNGSIAISSACARPELAWEFVRERLLDNGFGKLEEDGTISTGYRSDMPLNKASIERFIKSMMTPVYEEVDGEKRETPKLKVPIGFKDPIDLDIYAMTATERDFLMKAFDTITLNRSSDERLMNIIKEELKPYLEGLKSAEATAKIIQNRASVYVSEHGW